MHEKFGICLRFRADSGHDGLVFEDVDVLC